MQSILGNTRKTDITFHADGCIDISARVSKALSLQRGDVIDVLVGDGEVYLYVKHHAPTVGRHEAACYPTNRRGRHFRAYSKRLADGLFRLCPISGDRIRLPTGETKDIDGRHALTLIIHNLSEK